MRQVPSMSCAISSHIGDVQAERQGTGFCSWCLPWSQREVDGAII